MPTWYPNISQTIITKNVNWKEPRTQTKQRIYVNLEYDMVSLKPMGKRLFKKDELLEQLAIHIF